MAKLSVEQALTKAKSHTKKGEVAEAQALYATILKSFPNNKKAQQRLNALGGGGQHQYVAELGPPQAVIDELINLLNQGQLTQVLEQASRLSQLFPSSIFLYNICGVVYKGLGHIDASIEAYKKALVINPDYAEAHYNMGNAFFEHGKLNESIEAYYKAVTIKPDYAEAYTNMGRALKRKGKLEEAIEAYKKGLTIKPDYAGAYYNMGNALKELGKLAEAIGAYNNALAIKPDYVDALWNLSGTAENISQAQKYVEQCLNVDPNHSNAKLTLSALQFYEGDKYGFNTLMQSSLKDHPLMRSFAWAFNLPELPELYFHRWALFDRMIALSKKDRPFYEFGVWRGEAFQHLINTFKKGYGFDTFEGIPEDWHDEKAGTYSNDGIIPQIKGGEFIVGKFEDTLPEFFAEPRPMASVINFDADLYSSTICALNFSKPVIDEQTILIFDEFLINENWEQDEYKALNEFCLNNDYTYEVLAISFYTKQVAMKLIGI